MKKIVLIMITLLMVMTTTLFAEDGSLERIKDKGYFIVGLDSTFAPMGYINNNQEIVGFDVDLAKEVAKRLGVEVKFRPCEWDSIIFELRSKNIDMIWNGMTITPARLKQVIFSDPYLSNNQIIFTRKDSGRYGIKDLAGKVVGVQLGSSGAQAVEDNPIKDKIKEIRKYSTNVEALMDLEAGRIDAVVMDEVSGKYYNSKKSTLNYSVENLANEEFGVAFRKSDKDLAQEVNLILKQMKEDGSFQKIKEKWFGNN